MLFVSYRYRTRVGPYNYTITDTDATVFDIDEPESAEDLEDLERRVSTHVHKSTGSSHVSCTLLSWKPLKNPPGRRSPRSPALELDTRMFNSREEAVSVLRGMIAKEEITAEELQMAPCDVVSRIEERTVAQLIQRVHKIRWLDEAERKKLINWLSL